MKISKTAATTARRLFGLCQVDGRLDEERLRKVIKRLGSDKPRDFHAILVALQRLTRLELESRKVTVESAVELDEASRKQLETKLAGQYGPDLEIQYKTNADLIGGMRIRVGDDVFDASVDGRLKRLAAAF
ncbi:MAG: F0F1 ATP synthase subunit delta [Akkermansiaceae bacterium]|nr:F0F1 ATP synthase subunit delta [Akkermansiaceae bacterium]